MNTLLLSFFHPLRLSTFGPPWSSRVWPQPLPATCRSWRSPPSVAWASCRRCTCLGRSRGSHGQPKRKRQKRKRLEGKSWRSEVRLGKMRTLQIIFDCRLSSVCMWGFNLSGKCSWRDESKATSGICSVSLAASPSLWWRHSHQQKSWYVGRPGSFIGMRYLLVGEPCIFLSVQHVQPAPNFICHENVDNKTWFTCTVAMHQA